MKPIEVKKELEKLNLPLADIKVIFDGYFQVPFESVSYSQEEIPEKKANQAFALLKRGYPANYLAGYMDVQGLHIFLNESTLIPRSETIQFIFDYVKNNLDLNQKKVLDLCTGSGLIALGVKKLFPGADIYASDISLDALTEAKKSADYNRLEIHFLQSDFLKDIPDTFDVILSNPPYIEEDSKEVNAPFEPRLALFSGKDGLDAYKAIFPELKSHLKPKGKAFFELESTNSLATKNLFLSYYPKDVDVVILKDWYRRDRYLSISYRDPE